MGTDLPFSLDEYQLRLAKIRREIVARGLDGMLVHTPENIYYLTGYHTPGYYRYQACIVPLEGEPTPEMQRRADVTRLALEETIEAMKSGATGAEVNAACQRVMSDGGYGGVHSHRIGCSIGVNFPPDWGEGYIMSVQSDERRPLESGMTFHVIPMVMTPGLTIATTDTVMVTPTGGEALSQFDRSLHVARG